MGQKISIVCLSLFTAALDLDTYPLRNLIRLIRRGKPVLIMHIGFSLACFHAISLERGGFSKIATLFFLPL